MPVALYMMFSEGDAPTAKLPINIPQLDSEYNFTDTVLYERGFGLTYRSEEPTTEQQATQSPETSAPATTIAPPAADATSSTDMPATSDQPADDTYGNGSVQTGGSSIMIIAVLLVAALSAFVIIRYSKGKKE